MSWMNFNAAEKQQSYELIPHGTVASVVMSVRPGGVGEGGWLKQSQSSDSVMLDVEFVVVDEPFAKRKIWQFIGLSGGKLNDKGESIFGNMGKTMLRAILESARGINPDDESPQAEKARCIESIGDLNGLQFRARIEISKDKTGNYPDKNQIKDVITPDMKNYSGGAIIPTKVATPASAAAAAPAWAPATPPPATPTTWAAPPAAPVAAAAQVQPSEDPQTPPPAAAGNPTPAWAV